MRFCVSCGAQIPDESKFCRVCGSPQPTAVQGQGRPMQPQRIYPNQNGSQMNMPGGMQQNMNQGGMQQNMNQSAMQQNINQGSMQQNGFYPGNNPSENSDDGDGNQKSGVVIGLVITAVVLLIMVGTFLTLVLTGVIKLGKGDDDDDAGTVKATVSDASSDTTEAENAVTVDDHSFDAMNASYVKMTPMNLDFVSSDVTEYPTVKLYYTVEDDAGEPLLLTSPNAAIKETVSGGAEIERKVTSVQILNGNQGVSFNICADKSGSMDNDMDTMKNAMNEFVDAMDTDSGDRAELISFDSYIMYMCTYTTDKTLLKNGINNMVADGGTAFYDALYEATMNAGNQKGARCVIAFTDGDDNESTHSAQEVIDYANSLNVPIFIIGTTNYGGTYQTIAESTGGWFWTINSIGDMSEVLTEIYSMETDMYCIEYESDASVDAYSQRTVSCVVMDDTYGSASTSTFTPIEAVVTKSHTSRYEVIKDDVSWTEANKACIDNGGHLVTITSQAEMDEVCRLCEDAGIKYVWMGGYTSVSGSTSFGHWVTGEDFTYTSWYPGEPSRQDRDEVEEMYLMLWYVNDQWSWNDQRENVFDTGLKYFTGNVGYVCEYEE